jgi:hypothetical protein
LVVFGLQISEHIAKLHKCEAKNVVVYGFHTQFGTSLVAFGTTVGVYILVCCAAGGGKSTGFGLIYKKHEDMLKIEPRFVGLPLPCRPCAKSSFLVSVCRYRLLRVSEGTKKTRSRKQWKDLKKKKRTTWGTGRREAARAAKKAAAS